MTKSTNAHYYAPGHSGCPGCGPSNCMIQVTDAIGKDAVIVNATGCIEINSSLYPLSSWRLPYIHVLFENTASVAAGVSAALKAKGNEHTKVVVIAGDGATYDIGFGAVSGMLERNDDVLYICYDNELYANTGIQRSGATPYGAATTTSFVGKKVRGKQTQRKPIVEIAAMHRIPYAASASIAFPQDLQMKIKKALEHEGAKFIAVNAPCCLGAGFDGSLTIKIARLAVQSRLWFLFEYEQDEFKLNFIPEQKVPAKEYLQLQKRFVHLNEKEIELIQKNADLNYERIKKLCEIK